MKQQLIYKLMIAGVGLLCVPTALLAQKEKEDQRTNANHYHHPFGRCDRKDRD